MLHRPPATAFVVDGLYSIRADWMEEGTMPNQYFGAKLSFVQIRPRSSDRAPTMADTMLPDAAASAAAADPPAGAIASTSAAVMVPSSPAAAASAGPSSPVGSPPSGRPGSPPSRFASCFSFCRLNRSAQLGQGG